MNVVLWITQGILGFVFAYSGSCKLAWSKQRLIEGGQTGVVFFPLWAIRSIAASELAAAITMIWPGAFDVAEVLTPVAAIGLCLLMGGASVTHLKLHEPKNVAINATLFGLALFVAVGRF